MAEQHSEAGAAREQARTIAAVARRSFSQLGPARLAATALFALFAVLLARWSWDIPLLQEAERALYDLRASTFARTVDKEPRIAMIVYDDQTLRITGQRSPVDRTVLAEALKAIDAAGPKAIGIDLFFDMPQDDDELLVGALRSMRTPTFLAYADSAVNPEITYEQSEYLKSFQASIAGEKVRPASIRIDPDADGVARRWRAIDAGEPTFLALAMSGRDGGFAAYEGPIRYRVPAFADTPVFDKFPIEELADPEIGPLIADFLKDKYVLIGGDTVDRDRFSTPIGAVLRSAASAGRGAPYSDGKMAGLEVHAHMLAQLLDGDRPVPLAGWLLWTVAVLVVLTGALTSLIMWSPIRTGALIVAQFGLYLGLPFLLHYRGTDTMGLPAFGWVVGWLLAYASFGSAVRTVNSKQRRFAQNALGKYLPPSVASEIMKYPEKLALHGEKRDIFAVFTDLEGFTKLSHAIEPQMVATLLNDYLDRLADVVLKHGGTLDKFVGDAVVAFWGAPISRPDDGARAARAALELYQAGEDFRRNVPEGVPPVGRTRVGMHYGPAIVGNFGGEGRIQYTAFGDSMNTAARLEAANKELDTTVLVSREAVERTGLDWFRPMGTILLRGRSTPVDVFEPVPQWTAQDRDIVTESIAAHERGDHSALDRLDELVRRHGGDRGLANLSKRLNETREVETHAVG